MNITDSIVEELTQELHNEPDFSETILRNKVNSAIRELKMKRNYSATSMSSDDIDADLENYYSVILNVARYDYSQRGIEGEITHSENGIMRSYESRDNLFKGVHAFVRVF